MNQLLTVTIVIAFFLYIKTMSFLFVVLKIGDIHSECDRLPQQRNWNDSKRWMTCVADSHHFDTFQCLNCIANFASKLKNTFYGAHVCVHLRFLFNNNQIVSKSFPNVLWLWNKSKNPLLLIPILQFDSIWVTTIDVCLIKSFMPFGCECTFRNDFGDCVESIIGCLSPNVIPFNFLQFFNSKVSYLIGRTG